MDNSIKIVQDLAEAFVNYKKERIGLISSENMSSKLLKTSYLLGLSDQYGSRLPSEKDSIGNLSFGNLGPIDEINLATREITKQLFGAEECETRLISGLNGLTVLLFSLFKQGDLLFKMNDLHGGHLSVKPIAERLNIKMVEIDLDSSYRLDINKFNQEYREKKPKVIFLDSSYVLFPYPLQQIKEIVKDDSIIVYDGSQITGLLAAGEFQAPLKEGADIVHATTHKSFWGPQKSILLFKEKNDLVKDIHSMVKDVLVSNTHLHHIFALLIALVESREFGKAYAKDSIRNAKSFAEALDRNGIDIIAKDQGYTDSNQFWVDFGTKENAIHNFKKIEQLGISTNLIFLPGDKWGLRVAVNELTRKGADRVVFEKIAKIISDCIKDKKNNESLKDEIKDIKRGLNSAKYSFDNTKEGKALINYFINNVQ